jgi:hypothetical protein
VFLALFVTDLDYTLVGDDLGMMKLNQFLSEYRHNHGTKIVYSTGRSLKLYGELRSKKNLLIPDAMVTAVGTEIYYSDRHSMDQAWSNQISRGWDRESIVNIASSFTDLLPQEDSEQCPFKISYFLAPEKSIDVLSQLRDLLTIHNYDVEIIYSGSKDLDILPKGVNKGAAMRFLRQKWEIEANQTVVCGDSGNDISLFSHGEEYGIIVGNAQSELINWHYRHPLKNHYLSKDFYAMGILEGLQHFGFQPT